MNQHRWLSVPAMLIFAVLGTACGGAVQGPSAQVTITQDPCSPIGLPAATARVTALMREFDDASFVAQYTPTTQLPDAISELQRIRRAAEDLEAAPCLVTLKQLELDHMNTVIVTLTILMDPNTRPELIRQGITTSREQHDAYELELARILGVTFIPAPTRTAGPTPTLGPSPAAGVTPTTAAALVTNPGPTTINIRERPALEANTLGFLDVGERALLLGKTADGLWFLIEVPEQPGKTAWVYAQLAQPSIGPEAIPVVTPVP